EFLVGFGLALLLVRSFRGRSLLTVLFLLPMMVVPAVAGFIFYMLFQTDGPINSALGIHVGWLTDPGVAPYSIMLVDIWQWTPMISVYLYRQVAIATRWSYASAAAILVLIMVSAVAVRAIRPIEVAQEESFEELVGDEAPAPAVDIEQAIEAGARV